MAAASKRYPIKNAWHKGELALRPLKRWYVAPALSGKYAFFAPVLAVLALAGCGGNNERQDKNEPEGDFKVEVVEASFPQKQKLAKRSELVIVVRNSDSKDIPNVSVTMHGLDYRKDDPDLADQRRPQFVVNGKFKQFGNIEDAQAQTPNGVENPTYVDTWSLGPLKPGESKEFKWDVTAVQAGSYKLSYEIAAGLDGKARAIDESGEAPKGVFAGTVSDAAPQTKIAADGKTIVPASD
jgi:hypothetical protein